MTCKDCVHYDVCHRRINSIDFLPVIKGKVSISSIMYKKCDDVEKHCLHFKDKSKYIELPYPLRTKVFVIRSQTSDKNNLYIFEDYITGYIYGKYGLLMTFDYHLSEDNFERVFTDKLKAEEKLKELNNENSI